LKVNGDDCVFFRESNPNEHVILETIVLAVVLSGEDALETVPTAVQSVKPDSEPCTLIDKTDVPPSESIMSPVVNESEAVKSDNSLLSSSFQSGIVFDEIGGEINLYLLIVN